MSARYVIERWPLGWLLCGTSGYAGVPTDALSECEKLFPKNADIVLGIPHHFHAIGKREVALCVATPADTKKWCAQIEQSIAHLPPQERWWKGLDVGMSSAAIFAVFCEVPFRFYAKEMSKSAVPRDAHDFRRCSQLLELFPEWRANLNKVSEAYTETKWPAVVARWNEFTNTPTTALSQILACI
jgi:hypothetical protein